MENLTIDELKYIRNLIRISGDMGCKCKIGSMTELVECSKLHDKIERIINE